MFNFLDFISWPMVFLILLLISVCSALLILFPKVPLGYVRIHIGILTLSPIAAFLALVSNIDSVEIGFWRFDSLSWLWAMFVLTLGLIVQRYSVRYLLGDRSYRKYFTLLTITTVADSIAWLSDDLRLLVIFWGVTLLGLTMLIGLKREWKVARNATKLSGLHFVLSWLVLLVAILWLTQATGHWELSKIFTSNSLSNLSSWEKMGINLLLVIAAVIPAAQWPFQRWLLDSVVAPTPVSAVMHAGIVNAGGIMLTRFSPLFNGDLAQMILLVLSSISVLIGTGIMLVQVDYKRQLVGSTIAQMGFMLIQCAMGAYLAAITHAVLHGLFKSTLFLQAGSAVQTIEPISRKSKSLSLSWLVAGSILAVVIGIGFWLTSPDEGYQLVSSLILGWSVLLAWTQLVASGNGRIGRIVGMLVFAVASLVFKIVHVAFHQLLHDTVQSASQPHMTMAILLIGILLVGGVLGTWLVHHHSKASIAIYLWLVRLGEPKQHLVESHPKYLTQLLSRGGNL